MVENAERGGRGHPMREHHPIRDVPAIVGSNLKRLRKAHGLSLERLAEASGVSRAMLGQIENGKSVPTVSLLWKIADALAVSVTELMLSTETQRSFLIPREGAPDGQARFRRRRLTPPDAVTLLTLFEIAVAPGHAEPIEAGALGSRANLVVARGSLGVGVGGAPSARLVEGDAIFFDADVAYVIANPGGIEAVAYLALLRPAGLP